MTGDFGSGRGKILLGLVWAVPPLFWTGTILNTDVKVLAVRAGILFLFIAGAVDVLRGRELALPPFPILAASAAFCAYQGIVTLTAPYGDWAVYGDTCLAIGFFLAAIPLLRDGAYFKRIAFAIVPGAVFVSGYYLVHALGWDPVAWFNPGDNLYGSSFGNRNFMAYFLVCSLPFALYQALETGLMAGTYNAGAAMLIAGTVVYSGSRSGSLCLLLLLPPFLWFLGGRQQKRWAAIGCRAAGLASAAAIAIWGLLLALEARVWSLANFDAAFHGRLSIWSGTLKLIADSPWIGHGSGAFPNTFPAFQTPEFKEIFGFLKPIFHSHSVPLEILVESGLVGLTLFLGLLILGSGLTGVRTGIAGSDRARVFCCGASLAGAGIFSLTGEVSHVLFCTFFSWLSLAAFYGGVNGRTRILASRREPRYMVVSAASLILVAACLACLKLGAAFAANTQIAKATYLINRKIRPGTTREHLDYALRFDPGNPYALYQLAFLDMEEGRPGDALKRYEAIVTRFPYFENIHSNMGMAYIASGDAAKASEFLSASVRLYPHNVHAMFYLAQMSLRLGRPEDARAWLQRIRELGIQSPKIDTLESRIPTPEVQPK